MLIGSTQKMGTGTNVQKRLVALHHLDAPWKPAEVEQRDGRILRQGNENEEVAIYRYVTEGSFDAYMWQALETKARFIGQVITGDNAARRAEDIGGQELSYAEVKAIASGNPAVLTLAEADAELQRLTLLKKNHLDEQYVARRSVRDLPGTIASLSERLSKLTADEATATAHAGDPITIGKRTCSREDVPGVLAGQLDALPKNVRETTRVPLGIYRGLRFGMVLHPQFPPDVYLEGAIDAPVHALAGPSGTACRPERPGTPGQRLRLRMRPRPARPRHRRIPASRLPGPPGQALPARRLPVRTDQPCVTSSRPGFPQRLMSQADEAGPSVSELAETDQGAQGRAHHRGHAAARPAEAFHRRGTGHRPHPPPDGGASRTPIQRSSQTAHTSPPRHLCRRNPGEEFIHQAADDVPGTHCDGAATQGPGAKPVLSPQCRNRILTRSLKPSGGRTRGPSSRPQPPPSSLFSVPLLPSDAISGRPERRRCRPHLQRQRGAGIQPQSMSAVTSNRRRVRFLASDGKPILERDVQILRWIATT